MRVVYAVQFEIQPPTEKSPKEIPPLIIQKVIDWVSGWYMKNRGHPLTIPISGGEIYPESNHRVDVRIQNAENGDMIWNLVWSYPSDDDPNLLWESQCMVAYADSKTEFTMLIRLSAQQFQIRPPKYKLRRPKIVKTLVSEFPCYIGSRLLSATPQVIKAKDIKHLVNDVLLNPERKLPVIIITKELATDKYTSDPLKAMEWLLGLAEVYAFETKWATVAFTDEITRKFCCYNGAIRIVWPGFQKTDDSHTHPLYLMQSIKAMQSSSLPIEEMIFNSLSTISAIRISEGPITKKAKASIISDNKKIIEKQREELKTTTTDKERLKLDLDKAYDTIQKMQIDHDEIIAAYQKEIDDLKENFREVYKASKPEPEPLETEEEDVDEEHEIISVQEALERAQIDLNTNLIIWDSANDSATKSRFARPMQVYHALQAISEVAQLYFSSQAEGKSMGRWEDVFKERGFDYAAHESSVTQGKYGDQRVFTQGEDRRKMVKHITLGGGSRENCLQIYFDIDDKKRRFIIGYCGLHLDYSRQRT